MLCDTNDIIDTSDIVETVIHNEAHLICTINFYSKVPRFIGL